MPKSNTEYCESKINNNIARDKITYESLSKLGWNVLIVWECELKKDKRNNSLECLYNDILVSIQIVRSYYEDRFNAAYSKRYDR